MPRRLDGVGMSRRPPAPALPKADRTAGIAALSAIGWIAVASAQSSDSGAKARSREPSGRTTRPRLERYSALRRALVLRAQGQAPEAVPIAQIALRADEQSNLSDPDSFGCLRKSKQHEYASQRAITLKPWPRSPPARLSADRLGARVTQLRRRDRNPAGRTRTSLRAISLGSVLGRSSATVAGGQRRYATRRSRSRRLSESDIEALVATGSSGRS